MLGLTRELPRSLWAEAFLPSSASKVNNGVHFTPWLLLGTEATSKFPGASTALWWQPGPTLSG